MNEKTLGPQHPEVASDLNNLGLLYLKMDRLAEARELLARALGIREKAFGPNHVDTATNAGNLGTVLMAQGKYVEAEPLERRALAVDEKALGPEDAGVATDNRVRFQHSPHLPPEFGDELLRTERTALSFALGQENGNCHGFFGTDPAIITIQ